MEAKKPVLSLPAPGIPLPGQRILRSVLAVWLCILIYWLRGRQGSLFYSIIAALQCVQPYTASMLHVGSNRIRGTLVGAFWGAVTLFIALTVIGGEFEDTLLHYLLLGIFAGIDLYSTVLLKLTESSWFSTVVFMSICVTHIGDTNPWIFVFNRTLDTTIGVCVGIAACSIHLPRVMDTRTLYVSGVDYVLFREDRRLAPYTKVAVNRFIHEGMQYSVSTKQTPATVRELLDGINLRLPIIAMDGAVLYDLNTRSYLVTRKMEEDLVALITGFLHRAHMPFTVNTVEEDLLVIYTREYSPPDCSPDKKGENLRFALNAAAADSFGKAPTDTGDDGSAGTRERFSAETGPISDVSPSALAALHRLNLKKRSSPYRNYVHADFDVTENVLYILVIDQKEAVDRLYESMQRQPWFSRCRAAFDTFACEEGEVILRIYTAEATRAAMLEHLQQRVNADRTITFGNVAGECDVLISDAGDSHLVRELKRRFKPVTLRGWKNMIRL